MYFMFVKRDFLFPNVPHKKWFLSHPLHSIQSGHSLRFSVTCWGNCCHKSLFIGPEVPYTVVDFKYVSGNPFYQHSSMENAVRANFYHRIPQVFSPWGSNNTCRDNTSTASTCHYSCGVWFGKSTALLQKNVFANTHLMTSTIIMWFHMTSGYLIAM
jgi:hypothetical protein